MRRSSPIVRRSSSPPFIVALVLLAAARNAAADATLSQVVSPSELIPGPSAQGQVGDWLLANPYVKVVVDDIPHAHGFADTGGNIIDAAPTGGEDRFASMFTMFNNLFGRQGVYDTATVVDPGGGAATAHLRVSGHDSEVTGLLVTTDYYLGPNDRHVRVVTTLVNTTGAAIEQLQVGDAIQWGLTTHFAPGWDNAGRNIPGDGHDIGGKTLNVPWVGSDGLGSSYGYAIPAGLIELSNGSSWSDANVAYLDLAAGGGSGSYERFYVVGDGSLSSVSDAAYQLSGAATGTLSGTVTENGTGTPIAGATVTITKTQCIGTNGAVSSTIATTGAAGTYSANLTPGSYRVIVSAVGRTTSACATLTVSTGATTTHDRVLSQQGFLSWSATEGGAPVPCKVSILYSPLTVRREGPSLGDAHTLVGGYAVLSPTGSGSTPVPPGSYEVWISRGMEYEVVKQVVTVVEGATTPVVAPLSRVVDSAGYVSGDFHVHALNSADSAISFEMRVQQSACEGLELPVPTDHDWHSDMSAAIAATSLSPWVNSFPGNEVTTNSWGHINAYPITVDTLQPRGGALDHAGLSPSQIFGALHGDAKDPVVQVNHPRAGGLGYFDLTALNPVTGVSPDPSYSADFDAVEVFNGKRLYQVDQVVADWYRLLNRGQHLVAMGNTDTHLVYGQEIGYPRNFLYTGADVPASVTEPMMRDAARAGRSVLTNGPFVELWVDGQLMGTQVTDGDGSADVRVRIQAPTWIAADELQLIVNGVVVQTTPVGNPGSVLRMDQTFAMPLTRDSWIAAKVTGGSCETDMNNDCIIPGCPGRLDPVIPPLYGTDPVCPWAHTNPVWVDVDGDGLFGAPGNQGIAVEPIAAIRPVDASGNNTRLAQVVSVRGVATTPSYVFNHRSNTIYFQDGSIDTAAKLSGGTTLYQQSLVHPEVEAGDMLQVTGTITQFNGLQELTGLSIDVLGKTAVPDPLVHTVADLRSAANNEQWEGMLVRVNGLTVVSGTWPPYGSDASITVKDASTASTITMRLDANTDIDGGTAPAGTFDLVAVVGQFKVSPPFLGFYQLLPRSRADIIEPGDPLRILHGPVADPVDACSARIRWYTTKAGDSTVEYGTTPSYGGAAGNPTSTTSHDVTLAGLAASTTYHYRVLTSGVASADRTFTTAAGAQPQLVDGPDEELALSGTSAQIVWETDVAGTSVVHYGTTPAYGQDASSPGVTRWHLVPLSGLVRGATYHYQIESAASGCGGGTLLLGAGTFETPRDPIAPPEVSPSGALVPFTIRRVGGGMVELRWQWRGALDYHVYGASGVAAIDAAAWDHKICDLDSNAAGTWTTDGATYAAFTMPLAQLPEAKLVVVAESAGGEGSYGEKSNGDQRTPDADGAAPSQLGCGASCPTITVSPSTLPDGTVGSPYSQTITATGGTAPYGFAVTSGALPPGLDLAASGLLSGTPTTAGPFTFTVTATDAASCTGSRGYTVTIAPAGTSCPDLTINELDSDQVGTDMQEFVELHNATGASVDLAAGGYVLVFFNGAAVGDASYRSMALTGSVAAGGRFLAGNSGVVPTPTVTWPNDTLQNGADAVALYKGATCTAASIPNNTPAATTIGPCTLVDAVVYDTADPDDAGLLAALGQTEQIDENSGGSGTTHSIQRITDSQGCPGGIAGDWKVTTPTPGAAN